MELEKHTLSEITQTQREESVVCYLICANLLRSFKYFFNWHREVLKLERGTDLGKRCFKAGEIVQHM